MDKNEARIASLEKVILSLTPWINPEMVEDATAILKAELATATGREREVCTQAIQILADGKMRFKASTAGRSLRGE